MVVDFFFIVSGYYTARMLVGKHYNPFVFFRKRVEKLYPEYLLSYCLLAIPYIVSGKFFNNGYVPIWEILLLQNVGIPFVKGLNYPMWYLSVLMWGGFLLYVISWLAVKRKKVLTFFLFVIAIGGYCLLFTSDKVSIEQWNYSLFLYHPMVRGIADISIGMFIYMASEYSDIRKNNLGTIMLIFIFLLMLIDVSDYLILASEIGLAFFTLNNSNRALEFLGNTKLFKFLLRYEYLAYLNHALIILIVEQTFIADSILLRAAFIPLFALLFSMVIKQSEEKLKKIVSIKSCGSI